MRKVVAAIAAISSCLPMAASGQDIGGSDETAIEEVVVVGRAIETSLSEIRIRREILVDTAAALKVVPGANANANGPITGIAQYRGMYGDRVAVSIDRLGVVSGGPNAMDAPLSYVSPLLVGHMVVERGIAPVSSAPESIGGVVNVELDRGEFGGNQFGFSGGLAARYSDNGNVSSTAARMTLSNQAHRFSFLGQYDNGDDIKTPAGTIRPTRLQRERYDLSYGWSGPATRMMIFAGALDTRDTGTPALPMDIRFIDTQLAGLNFEQSMGTASVEIDLGWNDVEHLMDNFGLREAPLPMRQRQSFTTGDGVQYSLAIIGGADANLTVGLDGSTANHDAVISNPNSAMFRIDNFNDVRRDVAGIFTEWEFTREAFTAELGLRLRQVQARASEVGARGLMGPMAGLADELADAFNAADRDLEWRDADAVVSVKHDRPGMGTWSLELGSKSRAPSYQELFLWLPMQSTGGLADGRTYVGNLALDSERSNEIVLGFTGGTESFTFSPQFFFRSVDGYIQGVPSTNPTANQMSMMMSGQPALQFDNVDARLWGMDMAWKLDLSQSVYLDGILTYTRGERTDVKDNLYRLAPFNGSIGLTWQGRNWSLQPEWVYYGAQDRVSDYNGERPTDAYSLFNLTWRLSVRERLTLQLWLANILDRSYQPHLAGINRAAGSDISVGERIYGRGRTISIGARWGF